MILKFKNESGATLLQFALVFPLCMLVVLAIIDFARIQAVKGLLNVGASNGLAVARTIPNLDIAIHALDISDPNYDYDRYRYIDAKNKVIAAATDLPLSTFVAPSGSTSSWATFLGLRHYDDAADVNAAVLRPYECARVGADPAGCASGDNQCIRHHALRSDLNCQENFITDGAIYKREPIVVTMRATVETIIPLLGDIEVHGSAYGFREEIPHAIVDLSAEYGVSPTTTTSSVSTSTTTTVISTTTTTTGAACDAAASWGACINDAVAFRFEPRCPGIPHPFAPPLCLCQPCGVPVDGP